MIFQPALPLGGYAGWRFLNRTMEAQQAAFARSPQVNRDLDHFRARIGDIDSAEALVSDRQLLRVALGAFGLEADINNRFFIRKVLEDGTLDPRALANRLADKRYLGFSRAFGFGDFPVPRSKLSDFGDRIAKAYSTRQFEVAVGAQDENMRLALTLRRELGDVAAREAGERTRWFTVLGNPPLRKAFETAFGLPPSFALLDIDRQLSVMQTRTRAAFGDDTVAQFDSPERMEAMVRRFLLRSDAAASGGFGAKAPGSTALQLLQAIPVAGRGLPFLR